MEQEIKSRINKLDFDLKEFFENVQIKSKFYKTAFFDINANKVCHVKECNDYKRLEVKAIINTPDLIKDVICWSYSTNPLKNNVWIDRTSTYDNLSEDIINIFREKRFDHMYLLDVEPILDVIHEEDIVISQQEDDHQVYKIENTIKNILENGYGIDITSIEYDINLIKEDLRVNESTEVMEVSYRGDISMSNKFKIEDELNSMDGVNYTIFKENKILVNITKKVFDF